MLETFTVTMRRQSASETVRLSLPLLSSLVSVCTPYCIICRAGVAVGINVLKNLCIRLPQIHPPSSLGESCALLCSRFPGTLSGFCFPVKQHNVSVPVCRAAHPSCLERFDIYWIYIGVNGSQCCVMVSQHFLNAAHPTKTSSLSCSSVF